LLSLRLLSQASPYLKDESTLRLAILNACEGARASRSDPFAGAAQSLVLKGIPAVIAMQFEVSDDAAITLAHGFYSALADGFPVDAALAEARKSVFARGNAVEWGTPVLYLRSPDGRIFNVDRTGTKAVNRTALKVAELLRTADAELAREDWAAAMARCDEALKLESANNAARARLAQARNGQEATDCYERGLRLATAGRWSDAVAAFESAYRLRPDFRDLATRLPESQRRLAQSMAPPPLPPPPKQPAKPPIQPKTEPPVLQQAAEPAVAAPQPPRRAAATRTARPPRRRRRWIWAVAGVGVLVVIGLVGAALWEEFGPDDSDWSRFNPGPSDPWRQNNAEENQFPPLKAREAAAHPAAGNDKTRGLLDQAVKNLQAAPAGSRFQGVGTWDVRMSMLNGQSRLYFDSFGRFNGTASSTVGQAPVSGRWAYNPFTSILSLTYDNGAWFNLPLQTDGAGFSATVMVDGVWVRFHLQKAL
jgi:hypothetical protein